ncbi:MAG TPA: CBS domain-containing protein [Segeticoccus sp.]|jgi:CBS domain-containing protein|nr:CBS domain-containing protein [Segeticoccus sp.]
MLVREIMTTPALTVGADQRPREALRLMASAHVTALPVLDGSGDLIGMLSEADLLRPALGADSRAHLRPSAHDGVVLPRRVDELMSTPAHTVTEETDVADLALTLDATGWKSMPVVREGELVGMVSRSDIVRALWRTDAEIREDVAARLRDFALTGLHPAVEDGVVLITGTSTPYERQVAAAVASGVRGVRRVQCDRVPSPAR